MFVYRSVNFDMLGSPNFYRGVNRVVENSQTVSNETRAASNIVAKMFEDFFNSQELPHEPAWIDVPGRSDYAAFLLNGIASSGLATGAEGKKTMPQRLVYGGFANAQYDTCYHQPCDTQENISKDTLYFNAQAIVYALEHLGMHDSLRTYLYGAGSVQENEYVARTFNGVQLEGVNAMPIVI